MSNFQKTISRWYDRARVINPKIFRHALKTQHITWYLDENELLFPEIVLNKKEINTYQKVCQTFDGVVLT